MIIACESHHLIGHPQRPAEEVRRAGDRRPFGCREKRGERVVRPRACVLFLRRFGLLLCLCAPACFQRAARPLRKGLAVLQHFRRDLVVAHDAGFIGEGLKRLQSARFKSWPIVSIRFQKKRVSGYQREGHAAAVHRMTAHHRPNRDRAQTG